MTDVDVIHADDELKTALRVIKEAGLDVVIPCQYERLRAWAIERAGGLPPVGWKPRR